MEVNSECPHCKASNEYEVDLNQWLGIFNNFEYNDIVDASPLLVHIRPYTYKEVTKTSIKAIEQQKIFGIINNEEISDEEKIDRFGKSFVKLTELTVDIIADCITSIETPNGTSTDKEQIKEFINNCARDVFDKISNHISNIKERIELKARNVSCGECSKEFLLPITMDQSNFFAVRS
jgi:predicted transcriptional regulator